MHFHIKVMLAMSIIVSMGVIIGAAVECLRRGEGAKIPVAPAAACLLSGILLSDMPFALWGLGICSVWIHASFFACCAILGVCSIAWLRRTPMALKAKRPLAKLTLK